MDSATKRKRESIEDRLVNSRSATKCRKIEDYFKPKASACNTPEIHSPIVGDRTTPAKPPKNIPTTPETPVLKTHSNTPRTGEQNRDKQPTTPLSTPLARLSNYNTPVITPTTKIVPEKSNGSSDTVPTGDDKNHAHLSYPFLKPSARRDITGKCPDDPDYDERTLYLPEQFLNSQTPALRQWWLIKQKNMDAVLFFKMGKFYELFNEDAVIGVNNLDIIYMKGEDGKPAHAGFPEVSFKKYASILINKGFKVLRVEQTETPAMMEERCQSTGRRGKFDKVVNREVCQVTTKGTQMMGINDSVFYSSQNQYLLAVYETVAEGSGNILFGVCFIDVTIGKLHLGQFEDDHNLSNLNILLAHHTPTEVLYDRNNLKQESYKAVLKTGAILTCLKSKREFWPIKKTMSHLKLHRIFINESNQFEWPTVLRSLFESADENENLLNREPLDEYKFALKSFGAIVYYLNSQLIEGQVLKCTNFEVYETPLRHIRKDSLVKGSDVNNKFTPPMILDHIALKNLEIFTDCSGGVASTLYNSIDLCKTHFGQRLLKNWICSPLCDVIQIENRLDAIESLISNKNSSLMNEIVHILSQTPDLERMLSKIKSQCYKSEGDTRAIMFDGDQYSKAKIASFLNLLSNFKRLQKFITSIRSTAMNCDSKVLKRLLSFTSDDGLFPDYSETLSYFETAFDHKIAQLTGRITPSPGVDPDYDVCELGIREAKSNLEEYLEKQKSVLRCKQIEYFGTAKNRYQIQIPDSYCKSVPSDYRIETTRKGFKRYYTPTIDKYFAKLTTLEEEMKRILDNIMSRIFEQFTRKMKLWSAAIECVAILDVLQSIANFVRSLMANGVDVCRPQFLIDQDQPVIRYTNGRHPALVKKNPNFIPNDLFVDDKLILLSGANMGGKSTLMRQTALIVILAQIGCYVPASSLCLTPVDRIFTRLGASDSLLEGESTFYTELIETSAMLRCATKLSLILLDELGRGTSTYDGTAIAHAVIEEISTSMKCRCLFSTHYHTLARDFTDSSYVRLAHMACQIEHEPSDDTNDNFDLDPLRENLNFLYKIADGPAARSYGFNVAKLAGISSDIIRSAFVKAQEIEYCCKVIGALQMICEPGDGDNLTKDDLKVKVKTKLQASA